MTDGKIPDGVYACLREGRNRVETTIEGTGGNFTTYYPSGSVEWITHFKNGQLEGENKRLSEAGQPLQVSNFSNGLLEGEALRYDATGAVVARQKFEKGKPVGAQEKSGPAK